MNTRSSVLEQEITSLEQVDIVGAVGTAQWVSMVQLWRIYLYEDLADEKSGYFLVGVESGVAIAFATRLSNHSFSGNKQPISATEYTQWAACLPQYVRVKQAKAETAGSYFTNPPLYFLRAFTPSSWIRPRKAFATTAVSTHFPNWAC